MAAPIFTPDEVAQELLDAHAMDAAPEPPRYYLTDDELKAWMVSAIITDRAQLLPNHVRVQVNDRIQRIGEPLTIEQALRDARKVADAWMRMGIHRAGVDPLPQVEPEPHLASQPGIRGHSYDAEHALGERYRVVDLVGNSRTYVASRSSLLVAIRKAESLCLERKRDYRVEDAHGGNLIVADVTYQPRTNRAHVTRP